MGENSCGKSTNIWWGNPQNGIYLWKTVYFSCMFKLQSPSKYSPLSAIYLLKHFFHCSEQFLNYSILMSFSASAVFVSPLPHWQNLPFQGFIQLGEQKTVAGGEIRWVGGVGHQHHAVFGQKLLNAQHGVGRWACKSPIVKWTNMLKESSKKKITEVECSLSE